MPKIPSLAACLAVLMALTVGGCHSGPSVPDYQATSGSLFPHESVTTGAHSCLGFYSLAIDTDAAEVEIIPSRSTDWHFNVTRLLNGSMGVAAAMVPGESDPPNGLFVLDITLTHPFATKPQFSGFDVKGILITPGSLVLGPLVFADMDETRLENADGYTRWWNPTEFTGSGLLGYTQGDLALGNMSQLTATVNPYRLFADALGAESLLSVASSKPLDHPQGRAVFSAGAGNTRRYRIRFPLDPGPQVVYGYAIDCSWNPPSPNPPGEIPDDFPMNANQPEAWWVDVWASANTLYFDTEADRGGGVLRLQIDVYDWQGRAAGNIADEISVVRLFAPGLWVGGLNANFVMDTGDTARYTADLTPSAVPLGAGETPIICRIESTDGSTYQQTGEPAPDDPLSAYQVLVLDIPDPVCVTDDNNDWTDAVETGFGIALDGQVCVPDDPADYYYFDFPTGYKPYGEIRLYTNANPTTLGLYDESHLLIEEAGLVNAVATIELDDLPLMPTTNYIKIETGNTDQPVPYFLEMEGGLNDVDPSSPVEVTPPGLFVKADRVYNAHSYWILTGVYGLWVYDLSYPSSPEITYYEHRTFLGDATYYHPRLYYLESYGLGENRVNLINFSDAENPVFYEAVIDDLPYWSDGITQSSTHLYVGTPQVIGTDVIIFEFAGDYTSPTEVGTIDYAGQPHSLDLMNPNGPNKKLIVGGSTSILAFDVDDPTAVIANGEYVRPPGELNDMLVQQYRVFYTLYNIITQEGSLYALEHNMAVPDDFDEVGSIPLPGEAEDMYGWSPNIFIGDGDAGFTICDVDDPTAMTIESTTPMISDGGDVGIYGDLACVIPEEAGMQIFDVTAADNPQEISRLQVVNSPRAAVIKDDYMLVAEAAGKQYAIKIVDISDPPNAAMVNLRQINDPPRGLDIDANRLAVYTADYCQLWDVSTAASPQYFSYIPLPDLPTAVGVYGKTIYIATETSGMLVYDIADVYSPTYVTTIALTNEVSDFTIHDEYMYLSTVDGLYVFSIDTALSPAYIGLYSTSYEVSESEVVGKYLYIATTDTLEIADVTDPSSPTKLGDVIVTDIFALTEITVEGQYAYVQGGNSPVWACSVWPPTSPTVVGALYDQYYIVALGTVNADLLVDDGYLYGLTHITGIRIHDLY